MSLVCCAVLCAETNGMQNLSRRGLHGTALEYAKLLLGMDPTDPRGVLFCIDYLAIRAGQFNFLKVTTSQACSEHLALLESSESSSESPQEYIWPSFVCPS